MTDLESPEELFERVVRESSRWIHMYPQVRTTLNPREFADLIRARDSDLAAQSAKLVEAANLEQLKTTTAAGSGSGDDCPTGQCRGCLLTRPAYDDSGFCVACCVFREASGKFNHGIDPRCRACCKPLLAANCRIADGCPCNSARGVNHGVVPVATCTCVECDPEQTGSTRYPQPEPAGHQCDNDSGIIDAWLAESEWAHPVGPGRKLESWKSNGRCYVALEGDLPDGCFRSVYHGENFGLARDLAAKALAEAAGKERKDG